MKHDEYKAPGVNPALINISCFYYHYLLCSKILLTLAAFIILHVPSKFICGPDSLTTDPVFQTPQPLSLAWMTHRASTLPQTCVPACVFPALVYVTSTHLDTKPGT